LEKINNVLQLGEVEEIEGKIFNFAQRLNKGNTIELCSFAPLLQNPCCAIVLFQ